MVKRIILFASGSGSNVENIIKYFRSNPKVEVIEVLTNNPKAVIKRILPTRIPTNVFNKEQLDNGLLFNKIKQLKPDLIVLAGFLLKIPWILPIHLSTKSLTSIPRYYLNMGGKGCMGKGYINRSKMLGIKKQV